MSQSCSMVQAMGIHQQAFIIRALIKAMQTPRRKQSGRLRQQGSNLPKPLIYKNLMARPAGLEPATCPLGGDRSIQMS